MGTTVKIKEIRNVTSINADNTEFTLEIKHPHLDWIPYALRANDKDLHIDNNLLRVLIGDNFAPYVPPTDDEINIDLAEKHRRDRDALLHNSVDKVGLNKMWVESLPKEKWLELKEYRQKLLDVPQQKDFPRKVTWPTYPTGIMKKEETNE